VSARDHRRDAAGDTDGEIASDTDEEDDDVANGIVDEHVEHYLTGLATDQHHDRVLQGMEDRAREHDFPIVGRSVGLLLEQQARAIGARRVAEIGSGFGYSAYWFARAVGPEGEVVCSDLDPANRDAAEEMLTRAGLWDRVDFRVGDGSEVLAEVDGELDIVFCDADKDRYPEHWRNAAERVRLGGLYICDNTLWYGRVATGEPTPDQPGWTEAIVEHNRLAATDPRYLTTIVPIRDGVLVALRVE
jgi:caffeoyl-CoA O-methyltransferase